MKIREGRTEDADGILALLPRLADFEVPVGRNPEDLWRGDAALVEAWAREGNDRLIVLVAEEAERIVGTALVTLRPELLSGAPSGHLEALAIAPAVDGRGVGRELLARAESAARSAGALSLSLHVFANNERARSVYDRNGFDGELIRYTKPLQADD